MKLTLVTPERSIAVELLVEDILVPTFRGELNILEGHAPLMSTLSTGVLSYIETESKETKRVVISWGYLKVLNDEVQILAETAELEDEIDVERAKKSLKKAFEKMDQEDADSEKYQRKILRAQTRLDIRQQ